MAQQRLDMRFRDTAGYMLTVRVLDPLDTLTETQVETAMDTILTKNVFASRRGDIASKDSAQIINLSEVVTEWDFTP